jgi:hypothetical protein
MSYIISEVTNPENYTLGNLVSIITLYTFAIGAISYAVNRLSKILTVKLKYKIAPECLSNNEIDRYTKIYIDARFKGESNKETKTSNKSFLKNIIRSNIQYHIILGEAGMGKTALLLNLYYLVNSKINRKYVAKYSSLRLTTWLEDIQKIREDTKSSKTILLLDAFDEAMAATDDPDAFLALIEEETKQFYKVIITSRTHFFDSKEDEPERVSIIRAVSVDEEMYEQHYIDAFTDRDVNEYLRQKYRFNFGERKTAFAIIEKSLDIMSRPLLLSFIDDLVECENDIIYPHQIYRLLIEKWIDRESLFLSRFIKGYKTDEVKKSFKDFVNMLVIKMLQNKNEHGDFFVDTSELAILDKESVFYTFEKRNRSLLDRMNSIYSSSHINQYLNIY